MAWKRGGRTLLAVFVALLVSGLGMAGADTYSWIDSSGNVNYTDDPAAIPRKYRNQVTTSNDITMASPEVRREVEEGRQRAEVMAREDRALERVARAKAQEEDYRRKQQEWQVSMEKQRQENQSRQASATVTKKRRLG